MAQPQEEKITVENVSGVNNMTHESDVIDVIRKATYLTAAIGPNILPRIAPLIAWGISEHLQATDEKLYIIACENQIGATDILKNHILDNLDNEGCTSRKSKIVLEKFRKENNFLSFEAVVCQDRLFSVTCN